jgi:predicted SnoaL-like aldol condensation-catalyzing enzyme
MSHSLARNKASALDFHDMMFNQCCPAEAVARYVGDSITQHNPQAADGKQALIDIFRFDDTRCIVGHRNVLQAALKTAAHGNGML